jgi:hypothetical protein
MRDAIRKKQEALQDLIDAEERWMRKLLRAATAINEIRARKKRLLRPRKLEPHESDQLTSKDLHKIHSPEFFDDSGVLADLS